MDLTLGFTFDDVAHAGIVELSDVDEIVDWLKGEALPDYSRERITQFLVSCDGDRPAAKATIRAYVEITNGCDEIFSKRDSKRVDLQKTLNVSEFCILPERTEDGCVVLFTRLVDYNYRNYELGPYATVMSMIIESAIYDYPARGLITVSDAVGLSWKHFFCIRFGVIRNFTRYLQEALPVQLRKVYLINATPVFRQLLAAVSPFIRKEVMDKIEVYSAADMDVFYEKCLPRRLLPLDYGGEVGSFRTLHVRQVERLGTLNRFFAAEEKQRKCVQQ